MMLHYVYGIKFAALVLPCHMYTTDLGFMFSTSVMVPVTVNHNVAIDVLNVAIALQILVFDVNFLEM